MASHSFVQSAAVELETIAAMTEAFDAACKQLDDTGQPELVLPTERAEILAPRLRRPPLTTSSRLAVQSRARRRSSGLPFPDTHPP
jgi:hypothetical protein